MSTEAAAANKNQLARRVEKLTAILDVAKAMTAARDLNTLLALILKETSGVVDADRASIFLADRARGELWIRAAQGAEKEIRIPIGTGIAGYVAQTGQVVNIPDCYADPRFNRQVDIATGYHTRNLLCAPMRDAEGEIVGVIQALNKRDGPFTSEDEELVLVLGGQAAAALENAMLHEEIQRLFEGFVSASVVAIESRDPTTAGHSGRVASLTVNLAHALERGGVGQYANTRFTSTEIHEIRYASLLHDFGKVGVREPVLVKANKLFPHELDILESRFEVIGRTLEAESYKKRLDLVRARSLKEAEQALVDEEQNLAKQLAELEQMLAFVRECNRPTVLAQGGFERLADIRKRTIKSRAGAEVAYLSEGEITRLSIPRGSLTEDERKEIESHVVHTFRFLQQIPWTRALRRVPEIAAAHHEKLDGTGYPSALPEQKIPVQSRMMAISDIYDALTASDRPYKKAIPHEKALDILNMEAKGKKIDSELLGIFIEAEVPKKALTKT
ncbi:MAG: GAF domain-containing protein [Deltaproteobacteria bacterium]|nr:GAF domain-containing protein [Deltaproteobacteria bacterium]